MKIGERTLLPRVHECSDPTPIVANGFSCREQIAQAGNRQVRQMALHEGPDGPHVRFPEAHHVQRGRSAALAGFARLAARHSERFTGGAHNKGTPAYCSGSRLTAILGTHSYDLNAAYLAEGLPEE